MFEDLMAIQGKNYWGEAGGRGVEGVGSETRIRNELEGKSRKFKISTFPAYRTLANHDKKSKQL